MLCAWSRRLVRSWRQPIGLLNKIRSSNSQRRTLVVMRKFFFDVFVAVAAELGGELGVS
jgi:hypothetical protein